MNSPDFPSVLSTGRPRWPGRRPYYRQLRHQFSQAAGSARRRSWITRPKSAASAGRGGYAEAGLGRRDPNLPRAAQLAVQRRESPAFHLHAQLHRRPEPGDQRRPPARRSRDHAWMDHNSVLRPYHALAATRTCRTHNAGRSGDVPGQPGRHSPAFRPNTRLISVMHGSTSRGPVQPDPRNRPHRSEAGVLFLVDAAQTAGHMPIDVRPMVSTCWRSPGHKGLLGPLGTGGTCTSVPAWSSVVQTAAQGGTGSVSEHAVQPHSCPTNSSPGRTTPSASPACPKGRVDSPRKR